MDGSAYFCWFLGSCGEAKRLKASSFADAACMHIDSMGGLYKRGAAFKVVVVQQSTGESRIITVAVTFETSEVEK